MKLKKALICIAIIPACFVLYIVGELIYGFIAERQEERELFSLYKNEFVLLNDFILDNIYGDEASFYVSFEYVEDHEVTKVKLYDSTSEKFAEIQLPADVEDALITVAQKLIRMDFSFIRVTKSRISYGGQGHRMYVFSRNGRKPSYYYSNDKDDVHYVTYSLKNKWFLLKCT